MNIQIENNIQNNVPWTHLPLHLRKVLETNSKNYDRKILSFSLKNQLRYRGNLIRKVLRDEQRYYERVVTISRERLMLYPYHLADMIVKGLRITPFNYYISVIERLMQAEKSYDTLPNFTAADCLRLLGIGRNEYIDLMNQSRTKRSKLFGRKNVRELLPRIPCDVHIEPWWRVEVGMVLEDDIKMVSNEELKVIDELIDFGSQSAGDLDYHIVLSLYKKGLIYLDVPVTAVDRVQVPPLQGFVMNRVMGDYFETLLYKIFVSIDEHTTVEELANVLLVSIELVKQAVSLYCRLQFARKLDPETEQSRIKRHISWIKMPQRSIVRNRIDITPLTLTNASLDNSVSTGQVGTLPRSGGGKRIAFLYDSTLTAFLMMGNLSQGLKKHAVTMFEVGKLCEESMDSFLNELEKVSVLDADGEGEARRYFEHAVLLRSTILCVRRLRRPLSIQDTTTTTSSDNLSEKHVELDLVRLESLNSLEDSVCRRLLHKKYKLLVSMAPLSKEVRAICGLDDPPHLGPAVPEMNSLWFKMFLYHMTGYGPPSLLLKKGYELRGLPRMFLGYSRLLVTAWLHEPSVIPVANVLHINGALQYSPVLVQAYGVHESAAVHLSPFPLVPDKRRSRPTLDSSAVKIASTDHPAIQMLTNIVDLEHNCGYVTFVNIGVPDFGVTDWDPRVYLRKGETCARTAPNSSSSASPSLKTTTATAAGGQPMQSAVDDSHFAVSPVESPTSSPRNGYVSARGNELLVQELDQLTEPHPDSAAHVPHAKLNQVAVFDKSLLLSSKYSFDTLFSPNEEISVNMFTRTTATQVSDVNAIDNQSDDGYQRDKGQTWTILDCHFGIPLFDVDANTKICDNLLNGTLTENDSLRQLMNSNGRLSSALLEFISQCQYYPGENTSIIRRGRLIPLPKYNLAFNNGKVGEWSEK